MHSLVYAKQNLNYTLTPKIKTATELQTTKNFEQKLKLPQSQKNSTMVPEKAVKTPPQPPALKPQSAPSKVNSVTQIQKPFPTRQIGNFPTDIKKKHDVFTKIHAKHRNETNYSFNKPLLNFTENDNVINSHFSTKEHHSNYGKEFIN